MELAVTDAIDIAIRAWGEHLNWPAEYVGRLLLAGIAGGLVGLEREIRGRQAGFRTNILVCVGSALVMIVSISFTTRPWPHQAGVNLNIDPARIAYGIMTGIGFLGAGAILKNGSTVRGLTTAAAMWCVAAVGMAAGFGMYSLTIIGTLFIVGALWLLDHMEDYLPKMRYRTVTVRRPWKAGLMKETIMWFKESKVRVSDASLVRTPDMAYADVSVRISFIDRQLYYALERKLEAELEYELLATRED